MEERRIFRYSQQRERILDYVKNSINHPTADMVYEKMREEFPSISLGTVYRNLQMLSEQGIINKLITGSSSDRFDGDIKGHTHFQCDNCGKIFDISDEQSKPFPKTNHKITRKHVTYSGICQNCLNENQ